MIALVSAWRPFLTFASFTYVLAATAFCTCLKPSPIVCPSSSVLHWSILCMNYKTIVLYTSLMCLVLSPLCVLFINAFYKPEEDFFFVGFFFSSSSGTLRSMTIKHHGHLCPTRVTTLQLAINPATYTSDCDSTSSGRHYLHHGNINLT